MKTISISVAIVAMSTSAFAADLPSRHTPPVYVPTTPIFTWTGVYVGGQIGYEFGQDTVSSAAFRAPQTFKYDMDGIVGGAHVGYNWSVQGLFGGISNAGGVIGLEGDVDGSSYGRTVVNPLTSSGRTPQGTRSPVDGSIRGRVGVAVDRALFYATGGVAFASITNTYLPLTTTVSVDHARVGWTVGGGAEFAVDNNWSIRAEYRFTDFGKYADFPPPDVLARFNRETDHRVQVGFSYRFDPLLQPISPVIAKY